MNLRQTLAAGALLLSPALAFAHDGHDHAGLLAGLAHPLGGLDHLLAMLAGGLLGFAGHALPLLENGIAGSVLALGLLVALAARPPLAAALGLTALFALGHGVAHGLELPSLANPWGYAAGFVVATAALHGLGYRLARRLPQAMAPLVRIAGGLTALAGGWLLAA